MAYVKTAYAEVKPYITKDGSEIRELMHPNTHGNMNQSLAQAIVPKDGQTLLHRHIKSEELYHVTEGSGLMTLADERFEVCTGDTVYIRPGSPYKIRNTGQCPLKILCACSPAYSHKDTELLEDTD